MPAWLEAAGWGWLASLGLILGAVAGVYGPLEHRGIARVMAAGAGFLLASVSLDLVTSGMRGAGTAATCVAVAIGAMLFSLANASLAHRGAANRKRCGGCVEQPSEDAHPGSGAIIALGTLVDSVPEGIVLGIETGRSGAPRASVMMAFVLSNIPEALSAAAGMTVARRSRRYIFTVWAGASAVAAVAAGLSAALFSRAQPNTMALLDAFSAGALLAMVVEIVVPEATHGSVVYSGLIATTGFIAIALLLSGWR